MFSQMGRVIFAPTSRPAVTLRWGISQVSIEVRDGRAIAPIDERARGWCDQAGERRRVEAVDELVEDGFEAGIVVVRVGSNDVDDFAVAVGRLSMISSGLLDHAEGFVRATAGRLRWATSADPSGD